MTKAKLILFSIAVVVASIPTLAERILLPVVVNGQPLPGGHGSQWVTELTVTNTGSEHLGIGGIETVCQVPGCGPSMLVPNATIFPVTVGPSTTAPGTGTFISVDRATSDFVITLRVQDVSRQALTWGTRIPTVPESEAFRDRLSLPDVPMDDRFRSLLRIYDFDPAPGHVVRIRFRELDESRNLATEAVVEPILKELALELTGSPRTSDPGYNAVRLWEIPELQGAKRLRVDIEGSGDFTFWAFVSVTNNETQHVTVVAP